MMALKTFRGRKDGNSLKSQVKEGKIEQRVTVLLARVLGVERHFPGKLTVTRSFLLRISNVVIRQMQLPSSCNVLRHEERTVNSEINCDLVQVAAVQRASNRLLLTRSEYCDANFMQVWTS